MEPRPPSRERAASTAASNKAIAGLGSSRRPAIASVQARGLPRPRSRQKSSDPKAKGERRRPPDRCLASHFAITMGRCSEARIQRKCRKKPALSRRATRRAKWASLQRGRSRALRPRVLHARRLARCLSAMSDVAHGGSGRADANQGAPSCPRCSGAGEPRPLSFSPGEGPLPYRNSGDTKIATAVSSRPERRRPQRLTAGDVGRPDGRCAAGRKRPQERRRSGWGRQSYAQR